MLNGTQAFCILGQLTFDLNTVAAADEDVVSAVAFGATSENNVVKTVLK